MPAEDSTRSTIADRVARLHEDLAGQIPDAAAAFGAEQADLAMAGVPPGSARPGDTLLTRNCLTCMVFQQRSKRPGMVGRR